MKFFNSHEKGASEWKAFSPIKGDHVDMFSVKPPKLAHLRVKPGTKHHQQLFVLKHAR